MISQRLNGGKTLATMLIVCGLIGMGAASSFGNPETLLVFPPENHSNQAVLAWVGEGLALSVSDALRVPGVEVVDYADRIRIVEEADLPPNAVLSRASMIRVAQQAGVDLVVMGSYSGTAENLHVSLSVFDIRTTRLSGEISANGPLAALAQMENELAWNVLANNGLKTAYTREEFKQRTRTIPNTAYSLYVRSLAPADEDEQMKLLSKAVSAYPAFPDAQYRLGRYYYQKADCARAVRHLELGRRKDLTYQRGDFMLGTCYLESNSLPDAIRSYSSLLAFARPIEALNNRGISYLRKGDYPLALQDLIEARDSASGNLSVSVNLALLRHLQGDESAARAVLADAIKAHPDNGMLHYLLGIVLRASGDEGAAEASFAKAKSLGANLEKLNSEDPKTWLRVFPDLQHRPY